MKMGKKLLVDGQITEHFNLFSDNASCRCGCGKIVDSMRSRDFHSMREELRVWYNSALYSNSHNRCEAHNKAEGGSATSEHVNGCADDLRPKRWTKTQDQTKIKWFEICDRWGYAGGFGYYNGRFHIDNRVYNRQIWDKR